MPLVLVAPSGDRRFVLAGAGALSVGRDLACDVPILDPGVSRRHAELVLTDRGVSITDLASRNGTWINGRRVTKGDAKPNDTISFGAVKFLLLQESDAARFTPVSSVALDGSATIMRERAVPSPEQAVADVAGRRLSQLVSIAQRLGGFASVDALFTTVVDELLTAFESDRVALLLADADGALETRVARDRSGAAIPRPVPRAIANGVAERQVALLTHDASEDARTAGASVMQQSVRSAMAAPLLGADRTTLGVLYVDNLRNVEAYGDEDLAFLVAFASIAAAALERETSLERLRQAARARENFERYFTPQLADRIAAQTGQAEPGGVRRHVLVLFSDIRGFTAIAESLPPMSMAAQLNEYFGAMVDCVFQHEGALDKFIGDALMAYWGAPVVGADDGVQRMADRALAAAFDMQRALALLNARWHGVGRPMLSVGIGLHAGDAFIGNIGSPRRLEYTLIGDTVNIANRLCGLAQGGEILVSDAVRAQITIPARVERRTAVVPGRSTSPVGVWGIEAPPHDLGTPVVTPAVE